MSQRDGFATGESDFLDGSKSSFLDSARGGILKAEHGRDVAQRDYFKKRNTNF